MVVNCTAGVVHLISDMAGVEMPVQTFPLQAAVTEPVKPFPWTRLSCPARCTSTSARPTAASSCSVPADPFAPYLNRASPRVTEGLGGHVLELMLCRRCGCCVSGPVSAT
ncbi:hypothetical protein HBB16_15360 [Pseudonocardia sp. MCCB 268]|nr:hypothetical protein [Pseudonocardia cytotoxica]